MTHVAPLSPAAASDPGTLCLVELPVHRVTTITGLASQGGEAFAGVLQRLGELGFMVGETISVLQRGPGGREPLAVQIGDTLLALRLLEAQCVEVSVP